MKNQLSGNAKHYNTYLFTKIADHTVPFDPQSLLDTTSCHRGQWLFFFSIFQVKLVSLATIAKSEIEINYNKLDV